MKHDSVAICGADLVDRIWSDSATPWREVIGWRCQELDDAELAVANYNDEDPNVTARLLSAANELDLREVAKVAPLWFVVSWPEHVTQPVYNSDANYYRYNSEAEARAAADVVYGESGNRTAAEEMDDFDVLP